MVRAEIITIGDEILYGQILDTNTHWISQELDKIGIKTVRKSSVGDVKEEIVRIFDEAQTRADIVFITGGLGPTKDDLTKKIMADYFGATLELHPQALEDVTVFFQNRGRELTEINRSQAFLPSNCTFIRNIQGTAPAMWFEERGVVWVSMPGVPYEMKGIMQQEVLPRVIKHFETPVIVHKVIKTVGIGESYLSDLIQDWENALPEHIKLAYLPSLGIVKLRLTGFGTDESLLKKDIEHCYQNLLPIAGQFIFGFENDELESVLGELLKQKNATVSVAESCTGGYLGHKFTSIAGSSAYFLGGVLAYSNEIKINLLQVSSSVLANQGAVSEACIQQMAQGVRQLTGSTYGLATSGIAGPDGGTKDKPVGTVWIAVATPTEIFTQKLTLGGSRLQNIEMSTITCLNLLRKKLI
ncbi:MAG: Nicotinamide-nucleotide amidase [Bacteroidota bacterium]